MKIEKTAIIVTLILMILLVVCAACKDAKTEPIEIKQYPACGIVTEVNTKTDEVIIEDFNGNLWAFNGCEDWMKDDICAMIMSDEGTSEIYDDVILQVRYCG